MGSATQMGKRTNVHLVLQDSFFNNGGEYLAVVSNFGISDDAIRAECAGWTDAGITLQVGVWPDNCIRTDFYIGLNICGLRIYQGNAIKHPFFIDPTAKNSFSLGKMDTGIDTDDLIGIIGS